jgi:hypothetical protein
MKPLSPDTTDEAQRKHYDLMRSLPPERRLALAYELRMLRATSSLRIFDFAFPKPTKKRYGGDLSLVYYRLKS